MPGRGVTLQMLLEEKMLEPGNAAMTIEYLVKMCSYYLFLVHLIFFVVLVLYVLFTVQFRKWYVKVVHNFLSNLSFEFAANSNIKKM